MFNQLYKLCKRDNPKGKTPLENFTTETFVGILNFNKQVQKDFIELIGLPINDEYEILSQRYYFDDKKSFVDIVIRDKKNQLLCFIENKVNSKENPKQLEKYAKVLNSLKTANGKPETHLVYCTKNYDPKGTVGGKKIKPLRWFEIADLLKNYLEIPLIEDFLIFLNAHDMTNDLSLTNEDIKVMEGFKSTIHTFNNYLKRLEPKFKPLFCNGGLKLAKKETINQVLRFDRWVYRLNDILPKAPNDEKVRSDFNYGFYFNESRIYVGLYVEKVNPKYSEVVNIRNQCDSLGLLHEENRKNNNGFVIYTSQKISNLPSDKDAADVEILRWFEESFNKFNKLFKSTKYIGWKF